MIVAEVCIVVMVWSSDPMRSFDHMTLDVKRTESTDCDICTSCLLGGSSGSPSATRCLMRGVFDQTYAYHPYLLGGLLLSNTANRVNDPSID